MTDRGVGIGDCFLRSLGGSQLLLVDDDVDVWWRVVVILFVEICCMFETYTFMSSLYANYPLYCSAWLSMKYDLPFTLPLLDRAVKFPSPDDPTSLPVE